jgi:hypothetical protein
MNENPYAAPADHGSSATHRCEGLFRPFAAVRNGIGIAAVAVAALMMLLGLFITFAPGGETGWFAVAAVLAAIGLVSPDWRVRLIAVLLIFGATWMALAGYVRGLQYQQFLRAQGRS